MTTRILPPDEWSRLNGTDTAALFPYVSSEQMRVVVLEQAGRIVGACSVVWMPHIEGAWTAEGARGNRSLKMLLRAAMDALEGSVWFITTALLPRTIRRLGRLGGWRWPGEHFIVGTEQVCHRLQR